MTLEKKLCTWKDNQEKVQSVFYQTYCINCDGYGNVVYPKGSFVKKGTCFRYEDKA